jgi:uncharacterized membrane protein YeiB
MKFRNLIAVVVGVVVSIIIIVIGEALAHIMNPLPEGINMNDPEAFKSFVTNAPVSLHLIILLNYALACFVGGLIASSIAIDNKMNKAMSLGGIFMGVGMFSLISLAHPTWVIISSVLVFLPFAYLGGRMSLKISNQKK